MAKRYTRGKRSSGPKNQLWTVVTGDALPVTTGVTSGIGPIVIDEDWVRGASAERATILRVRGWLSWASRLTTGNVDEGSVAAYILLADEAKATFGSALAAASYSEADILWTGGVIFPAQPVDGAVVPSFHTLVDIKAMRKIRAGQRLMLIVSNIMTGTVDVSFVLRALMRLGGN